MDFPEPPRRVPPWSRALDVVLHRVGHHPEGGVALTVAFGALPPRTYGASIDDSDADVRLVAFDEPLFFGLSEWSVRRYANAALYQMELGAIAQAFARGDAVPGLPVRLGTTAFAEKPSIRRRIRGHVRRLLYQWNLLQPEIRVHADHRSVGSLDPRGEPDR